MTTRSDTADPLRSSDVPGGWSPRDVRAALVLLGIAAAVLAVHLVRGPNFVLDDWYTVAHGRFDGMWSAPGSTHMAARPGTIVAYGLTFGLFGNHPLPVFLVLAATALLNVALLYVVLRRFLSLELSALATGIWVIVPNHLSLEVWPSATNIGMSLACLLFGIWLVARPSPGAWREVGAVAAFVVSGLFYEATIPIAGAAAVGIPLLVERRIRWRFVFGTAVGLGALLLWIVANWNPRLQADRELADVSQALPAHFGWGLVPEGPLAAIVLAGCLAGIVLVAFRCIRRRGVADPREAMVLIGLVVMVAGVAPFANYYYAPFGAGDRLSFVSSVGGAVTLAGLLALLEAYRRPLAMIAVVILLAGVGVARWQRSDLWDRAGNDGVAILALVEEQYPDPEGTIAIGPSPIQEDNVAAFLDHSNITSALRVAYDDPSIEGAIAFGEENFAAFDQRVDIREVSTLRSDVVVRPGD